MKPFIFWLFSVALLLAACQPLSGGAPAVPPQASEVSETPEVWPTSTPIPATATPSPTKTPEPTPATTTATPIETPQSEAGHIKWERVEANREAVNDYVFVDTIFGLNKDGAYFKEYGITTKEQLKQFIEDNGGYFPASQKNSPLVYLRSTSENFFKKVGIRMDKKLKADLNVEIVNPDQIKNTKIYGGQVHPWFLFQGQDGTSKEKCVSVAVGIKQTGDQNEIVLQLVWKDGNFDLFGNKLQTPNVVTPEMIKQANDLLRGVLISGYLLGQPEEWVKSHQNIMLGHIVIKTVVFNFIKEGSESEFGILNFPPQIIQ